MSVPGIPFDELRGILYFKKYEKKINQEGIEEIPTAFNRSFKKVNCCSAVVTILVLTILAFATSGSGVYLILTKGINSISTMVPGSLLAFGGLIFHARSIVIVFRTRRALKNEKIILNTQKTEKQFTLKSVVEFPPLIDNKFFFDDLQQLTIDELKKLLKNISIKTYDVVIGHVNETYFPEGYSLAEGQQQVIKALATLPDRLVNIKMPLKDSFKLELLYAFEETIFENPTYTQLVNDYGLVLIGHNALTKRELLYGSEEGTYITYEDNASSTKTNTSVSLPHEPVHVFFAKHPMFFAYLFNQDATLSKILRLVLEKMSEKSQKIFFEIAKINNFQVYIQKFFDFYAKEKELPTNIITAICSHAKDLGIFYTQLGENELLQINATHFCSVIDAMSEEQHTQLLIFLQTKTCLERFVENYFSAKNQFTQGVPQTLYKSFAQFYKIFKTLFESKVQWITDSQFNLLYESMNIEAKKFFISTDSSKSIVFKFKNKETHFFRFLCARLLFLQKSLSDINGDGWNQFLKDPLGEQFIGEGFKNFFSQLCNKKEIPDLLLVNFLAQNSSYKFESVSKKRYKSMSQSVIYLVGHGEENFLREMSPSFQKIIVAMTLDKRYGKEEEYANGRVSGYQTFCLFLQAIKVNKVSEFSTKPRKQSS